MSEIYRRGMIEERFTCSFTKKRPTALYEEIGRFYDKLDAEIIITTKELQIITYSRPQIKGETLPWKINESRKISFSDIEYVFFISQNYKGHSGSNLIIHFIQLVLRPKEHLFLLVWPLGNENRKDINSELYQALKAQINRVKSKSKVNLKP